MKALVIGGTLFIGRALVRRLLERGDEVTILHRGRGTPYGEHVRELRCDRNDAAAVRAAVAGGGWDVVYDNVYDWQRGTTAEPVVAAAEAAAAAGCYVFTSSVAAFGSGLDHDADDALAPADHPERYVRDKANTERALFALHAETGLPVATLRPPFVYGPENPFYREAFFWDRMLAGRPILIPGDGSNRMQLVHVDDVARAAIAAAEAGTTRAYNLGNEPAPTQVEYVRLLARAAGLEDGLELVHVPRERLEAAGGGIFAPPLYFGEYLDVPAITMRTAESASALGMSWTPLANGLEETFAWYGERRERRDGDFGWEERVLRQLRD